VCVCVCVCVCESKREREREKESVCVCLFLIYLENILCWMTNGAMIALAGPWDKSAALNQPSNCLLNSKPVASKVTTLAIYESKF